MPPWTNLAKSLLSKGRVFSVRLREGVPNNRELPERLKGASWKDDGRNTRHEGSNPSLSAMYKYAHEQIVYSIT